MQEEPKRSLLPLVHTLIGLTIMFSGHFLPCPAMVVETSDKLYIISAVAERKICFPLITAKVIPIGINKKNK